VAQAVDRFGGGSALMRSWLCLGAIAMWLSVWAGCGTAPPPAPPPDLVPVETTVLKGTVTQSGGTSPAVDGATVRLSPLGADAKADAAGQEVTTRDGGSFTFEDAPDGSFALVVTPPSGSALRAETIKVSTLPGETVEIVVRLVATSTSIDAIVVTPDVTSVGVGRLQQFTLDIQPTPGSPLQPTWSVTCGIGAIDAAGRFTATKPGTGQVYATLGGIEGVAAVEVPECVLEVRDEPDYNPSGQACRAAVRVRGDGPVDIIVAYDGDGSACADLIRAAGGTVTRQLDIVPSLVATVPAGAVAAIEDSPLVRYVSLDSEVTVRGQQLTWGVDVLDAERVWGGKEDALTVASGRVAGKGVRVAIIDTGIDAAHPDLDVAGGANIINPDAPAPSWQDDEGHGTRVAGIIAARDNDIGIIGIAPEASLYAVKVLDMNGNGQVSDVVAGIDWCVANQMHVINLSLGVVHCEVIFQEACDRAYAKGMGTIICGAAGNVGQDIYTAWPGNFGSVVSVGGTDQSDQHASLSVKGDAVELAAPGKDVLTTQMGGGYILQDGTSFSAPHVAGVAALVWSTGRYSTAERVRQHLRDTAIDLGSAGRDQLYGYGRVSADVAVRDTSCSDQ